MSEPMGPGFESLFSAAPVMAILRGMDPERALTLSRLAWSAGVTCVEVPLQTEADEDTLHQVAAEGATAGRVVGAGTILSASQVRAAAEAGARFTVSPGWDVDIARASLDAGLHHLPGVGSGTDVQHARRFGLGWVKAFPAAQLGPGWISAMKAPFPDMAFVATGGITFANAVDFLRAGASAVAIGSALAATDGLTRLISSVTPQVGEVD